MKKIISLLILTTIMQSCSWFSRNPSGIIPISGTFIYEDLSLEDSTPIIVYSFKGNNERSFLGYIPAKALVKGFFDNKKDIPFKGDFKGEVIYDNFNRIDFLKINQLNSQNIYLEIKGKDIN